MLSRSILIVICLTLYRFVSADSLYDANDPILELDVDTFNAAVYNSDKAHFVEFYSSWCGACIAYAPTFKEFARHIALWKPFVQVTVVNCADDKNLPLCREHSVNAFPTIKFFKKGATSKDDASLYQGNKYELPQMELDVAAYVEADTDRQKSPLSNIFLPIESSKSLNDIWSSAGSVNLLGVAVQENPALKAWALIINFHNDRNVKLVLARPQHPEVVKHLGADANGKVLLFKRGESMPVWTSPSDMKWLDIQKEINDIISDPQKLSPLPEKVEYAIFWHAVLLFDLVPFQPVAVEPQAQAPVANVDMTQYQVQLVDLKSALSYMLYKEIARRAVLDGENLTALKQWTRTLSKYAPGTTPMRRFLYRLNEWLWSAGDSVAIDDWTKKLDEIQVALGNPIPKKVEWIACIGSKPNLRGYSCGLWTIAHAISVEAYKMEANNPSFNPVNEVLEPFHQFIAHFFSCAYCAKHFDQEVETHKMQQVSTREEMVMWLWRVHNFVNTRLSGSRSDDPRFPKRQFPPSVVCTQCYDSTGTFDEKEILNFMLSYYSDIRQDSVQSPPEYKLNEYKDGKLQAVGARHLNPKFAVNAEKVDKLEETEERLRKALDASPQREWKDIEGYGKCWQYKFFTVSKSLFFCEILFYIGDAVKFVLYNWVLENLAYNGRSQFLFVWLSLIAVVIVLIYCKYRRNRSKFWKTFYYHSDFKL
ncbi:unnamed protein product [Haemonchus placei]|uniref:Sulfhydryl oxidase n=1 Tax=Haemonchus placei TaxID=6290 RepID=A0A0N4WFD1_HAEPC|nr:unnamed protein product [Haemonchus placei]